MSLPDLTRTRLAPGEYRARLVKAFHVAAAAQRAASQAAALEIQLCQLEMDRLQVEIARLDNAAR